MRIEGHSCWRKFEELRMQRTVESFGCALLALKDDWADLGTATVREEAIARF